jgi:hypothetical protein
MSPIINSKFWIPGLIFFATILTYYNGIDGEFVFDDIPLVATDSFYSNSETTTLDCWKRCYWRNGMEIGQYRPVTLFSFLWNARITGLYSPSFRLFNLLLHALIVILVLKLAITVGLNRKTAVFATLLFAVHPLHAEAVIPATGRAELLCALFVLLGLIAHAKFSKRSNSCHSTDGDCCVFCDLFAKMAATLCLIIAFWSKENGIVLLPLCLLFDVCFRIKIDNLRKKISRSGLKSTFFTVLREYVGFAIAIAIVAITRFLATGAIIPKVTERGIFIDNPIADATLPVRVITAFHVQGLALFKFIWPATLSHDYSFAQIPPLSSPADLLTIIAVVFLIILPIVSIRFLIPSYRRIFLFLWLAYLISILPAANFIVPTGTIFGERLCYLPSVWLCFGVTLLCLFLLERLERLLTAKRIFLSEIVLSVAIIVAILRTNVRADDWKNTQTLAVSAAIASPLSVKSWNNLAIEFAHEEEFPEAIAACDKAIAIKSDYQFAIKNKIYYLIAMKKFDDAENEIRKVLIKGSNDPDMYNKMAGLLARKGNLKDAIKLIKHSLSIKPDQKQMTKSLEKMIKQLEISQ